MNKKPIEQANDPDLRSSLAALQRAAIRAREVAQKTGTAIVISKNGVIKHLQPQSSQAVGVQEPTPPYKSDK